MPRGRFHHRGAADGHTRNLKAVCAEGMDLTLYLTWRSPPPPHLLLLDRPPSGMKVTGVHTHSSRPFSLRKCFPRVGPGAEW